MQVQRVNSDYNNSKTNFGAKLSIINKNKTLPFTEQGLKTIEDLFEKNTKNISGKLDLVSDKRRLLDSMYNDGTYWEFNFRNNRHQDKISGYMKKSSDTVEGFTKQIIDFLNVFKTRENDIAVYEKIKSDYYAGTYKKLTELKMDVIDSKRDLPS